MTASVQRLPTRTAAAPPNWVKTWLPLLLFSLLWVDLVRLLSGNWEAREQYAYGWFVPFLALALLWRRWLDRPLQSVECAANSTGPNSGLRFQRFSVSALVILLCLLLLPLRVIFEINTDWPLIAWAYTLIVVALTLYAFQLFGGWPWVRHFAFPVCFVLVALVWPSRLEKGLTQNLMQVVASLTVEIIGWFGVPALQRGNLIEVTTGVVGVDEACSGIRSFQSTLMAALFLGELYRLNSLRRVLLLIGGVVLSFCLNVVRTMFLTYQASAHGISAIDKWHDSAGMSIFLISFACLCGIAVLIKKRSLTPEASVVSKGNPQSSVPLPVIPSSIFPPLPSDPASSIFHLPSYSFPRIYLVALGCWSLLCLGCTEAWYRAHDTTDSGNFHWMAAFPEGKSGYEKIELPPRTLKLLSFDLGASGRWKEPDGTEWSGHFFRWNPRSVQSVISSRLHRPEVCLPASGLQQVSESELVTFDVADLRLPFRKYEFTSEGRPLYVFFCQWEDGSENQSGMQASKQADRLQSVLGGRRHVGQQTMELILVGYESLPQAEEAVRLRLPQLVKRTLAQQPRASARPSAG